MLIGRRQPPRFGITLVEMLVALTIGGVVLGLIASIAFRQRRFYDSALARLALSGELRETAAILPIDLRGLAAGVGDIRPGEARDTSLEVRATIGSAVVCDTSGGRVVLAPIGSTGGTFAGFLTPPEVNDTAWMLATIDTAESWRPRRITGSTSTPAGSCGVGGPSLSGTALASPRTAFTLDSLDVFVRPGVPIRVTRPARYSTYRASDGRWYFGYREWNAATGRFNIVQPVTGAFLAPGVGGLRFRYFDSLGVELTPGTAPTTSVALITAAVTAETKRAIELPGSSSTLLRRRTDSLLLSVRLRNRR